MFANFAADTTTTDRSITKIGEDDVAPAILYVKKKTAGQKKNSFDNTDLETLEYLSNFAREEHEAVTDMDKNEYNFPIVMLAIKFSNRTVFAQEFLDKIFNLDYPKDKLYIYITIDKNANQELKSFVTLWVDDHCRDYSFHVIVETDPVNPIQELHKFIVDEQLIPKFVLFIRDIVHLERKDALIRLVLQVCIRSDFDLFFSFQTCIYFFVNNFSRLKGEKMTEQLLPIIYAGKKKCFLTKLFRM